MVVYTHSAYKIENFENSGIYIVEDENGWLWIVNDIERIKYFCIEDIEKSLGFNLTLRQTQKRNEHMLN